MNTPLWLSHPAVQQLLHFLVDRLDHADQQGKELTRLARLDAKSLPLLFRAEFESDQELVWSHVEKLAQMGWIHLKLDKTQPGQASYELNPRVQILDVPNIRAAAGRMHRTKSAGELWRQAVFNGLLASDQVRESVCRYRIEIPGRLAAEIVGQLNTLQALADEPLLLREISARLFWGHSKVLDGRQALVAALLNLAACPFPEMPVQLQVFLPSDEFEGVLLIENQTTFEQATRDCSGQFARLALVFASGFKGSAKRLRTTSGASVYFAEAGRLDAEPRKLFLSWLRADSVQPCWFWGDLDYAGMEILKALRKSFPNMAAWRPGYAPMLRALHDGGGHAPDEAGKGAQRVVLLTGCPYADGEILSALEHTGRFVDQELA